MKYGFYDSLGSLELLEKILQGIIILALALTILLTMRDAGKPAKSSCSQEVLNRGWLACDNPDCCEEMRPALREVLTPEMTQRAIEAYQKK